MKIILNLILILFLSVNLFCMEEKNEIELKFKQAGLVKISSLDKTIKVDLVNSSKNKNYFRKNFYDSLESCYLQREVALKLVKAQLELKKVNKNYSLKIYDGARPRSVSWEMYNQVKGTKFEKFVAYPQKGSMHNYGAAVDLTIININGKELDMGENPFNKSKFGLYFMFLKRKLGLKLSEKQKANRELLSEIMIKSGFKPLSFEWWHFNGFDKKIIRKKYKIIE